MSDSKPKTSPEEIKILLKRTGLKLNDEQFDVLCRTFDDFEAAAQRLRQGIERNDEPAFGFRAPK
jgi:hypothetical protein